MNITSGKIASAQKLVLYAPEGFGKSTFASKFPDPLYIDTEGSTKELDVKRFEDDMSKWENILEAADYVIAHPECCKTLVIDTVDWAEQACLAKLNKEHNTSNILTLDYGKGSLFAVAEFQKLIDKLNTILSAGKHIVLLAHARMEKQELPEEMGALDHWGLKLQSKQIKALVKEWADIVLFGNYKTYVVVDDKTKSKKAQGNKRVLYTEHHACWDAKNRHGFESDIAFIFEEKNTGKTEAKTEVKAEVQSVLPAEVVDVPEGEDEELPFPMNDTEKKLRELMKKAKITEDEVIFTFHEKGKFTNIEKLHDIDDWGFIEKSVIGQWVGFMKAVEKYGKDCPFCEHIEEKKKGGK